MLKKEFMQKYNLIELSKNTFDINIVYATQNNFTKQILYNKPICMLRKKTAEKLLNANKEFNKLGYKIKIWDSFRPIKYQEKMWEIFPDERFVSNPNSGKCNHCRGSAVDITLCKISNNEELKMPTNFDYFGEKSFRNYDNLEPEIKNNVLLLENIMLKNGFTAYPYEWWHFDDSDKYELIYEMYD